MFQQPIVIKRKKKREKNSVEIIVVFFFFRLGSMIDPYRIGLFQTCSDGQCRKNQYGDEFNSSNSTNPIFSQRYFNAGPLSIISILVQIVGCFHCFVSSCQHLPCRWSITSYISPFLILIAFIFQFSTLIEASYGILLNGQSSRIFQGATVLLVATLTLTSIGADRIYHLASIEYV